jgi:hypothetical protein
MRLRGMEEHAAILFLSYRNAMRLYKRSEIIKLTIVLGTNLSLQLVPPRLHRHIFYVYCHVVCPMYTYVFLTYICTSYDWVTMELTIFFPPSYARSCLTSAGLLPDGNNYREHIPCFVIQNRNQKFVHILLLSNTDFQFNFSPSSFLLSLIFYFSPFPVH